MAFRLACTCGHSYHALVTAPGIVGGKAGVEHGPHLARGLEPSPAAHDAAVFIEKGAVQALDDAVGLPAVTLVDDEATMP